MKRIVLLITVTTLFFLSGASVLAKNDAAKGKGSAAGSEKGGQKAAAKDSAEQETQTPKTERRTRTIVTRDPRTGKTTTREVAVSENKEPQKEVKAVKEKDADEAKAKAEKKAEEVKKDKAKGKGGADGEAEDSEKAAGKGKPEKTKAKGGKDDEADDSDKAAGKGKPEGKGLGKDQKAAAMAKQMQHEDQKHAKRQQRLADMLKVAQDKGDDKAVGRIQELIDKENSRYEKKNTKMTEKAAGAGDEGSGEPEKTDGAAVEKENE